MPIVRSALGRPVGGRGVVVAEGTRLKRDAGFAWNINENRPPWGFAENAEVWNGRVGMMSFVYLMIQEAIFGPILAKEQPFGSVVRIGHNPFYFKSFTVYLPLPGGVSGLLCSPRWKSFSFLKLRARQVMSGAFVAALVALTGVLWLNQENDPIDDITLENLEDYM